MNLEQISKILSSIESGYTLLHAYTLLLDKKNNVWGWWLAIIKKIAKRKFLKSNILSETKHRGLLFSIKNWLNKITNYKIDSQNKYKKGLNNLTNIKEIKTIATTIGDIPKNSPVPEEYKLQLCKAIDKINKEIFGQNKA